MEGHVVGTRCAHFAAALSALSLLSGSTVQQQKPKLDTTRLEEITGFKGAMNESEGVFKVTSPRSDVKVSVDEWQMALARGIKAALDTQGK